MEVRDDEEPITFNPVDRGDIILSYDNLMAIFVIVAKTTISRIQVDRDSSVNLIYWNCFEKIHISHD